MINKYAKHPESQQMVRYVVSSSLQILENKKTSFTFII
jgi:hypothetical protein